MTIVVVAGEERGGGGRGQEDEEGGGARRLASGRVIHAERREYINRKNAAIFQDKQHPTIISIIIDGMDQSSCTCPFVGTQNGFVDPFPMHFTGVKEHGQHVTLYRTVGAVSGKSPDLTIYCILHQLEKWVWRNQGRYPYHHSIHTDYID